MYSERLQLLLSPEQRRRLEQEAKRRKASVASLIREAIEQSFGGPSREERMRAVEEMAAMEGGAPLSVGEMERIVAAEREEAIDPKLLR